MKKRIVLCLIIMIICVFTGCNDTSVIKEKDKMSDESVNENITENEECLDLSINDLDLFTEVPWPSEIPDAFPENIYGTCFGSEYIEGDDNLWDLYYIDMTVEDIENYKMLLKSEGWIFDDAQEQMGLFMSLYTKEKDQILISVNDEDPEEIIVVLYLIRDGGFSFNREEEPDFGNNTSDNKIALRAHTIPEGYPLEEVPLYMEAETIRGMGFPIEDGKTAFTLSSTSTGTLSDIVNKMIQQYETLYGEVEIPVEEEKSIMMSGDTPNYSYMIIFTKTEDIVHPINIQYMVNGK